MWRFNPPSAPHQDGIWERLVLSMTRKLCINLRRRHLTDGVFHAVFCFVNHSLVLRPLTPVGTDLCDMKALRTEFFILGEFLLVSRLILVVISLIIANNLRLRRRRLHLVPLDQRVRTDAEPTR